MVPNFLRKDQFFIDGFCIYIGFNLFSLQMYSSQ